MHLGLDKKVVLVTGGTKAIGRAIVGGFLAEGATVHFCARTASDIESTNQQLSTDFPSTKAVGSVVDVSITERLTQWVSETASAEGRIDVVVANVSALTMPDTPENWQKTFNVDMMSSYHLIQTALPHLEKTRGAIVSIGSVTGRDIDFTAPSPYGAFKAALIHYTSQLAHTLAPKGVRANTVSPGNTYVEDGVWAGIERNNPALFKSQFSKNGMGRMGRPEEVADAVVWLSSERASFVSGVNLNVDGSLCTGVQF